jgi:hypothetical protein
MIVLRPKRRNVGLSIINVHTLLDDSPLGVLDVAMGVAQSGQEFFR